jgi:hypothetical protein
MYLLTPLIWSGQHCLIPTYLSALECAVSLRAFCVLELSFKSKFSFDIGLAGPLHGLANQEVLVFLSKVTSFF